MLYSITADMQKKDTSNRYMTPDIHENSELVSVAFKTTDNGNELIEFNFENSLKERLCHTEWRVNLRKPIESMTEKEQNSYFGLITSQLTRINTIATTFISEEEMRSVTGVTFADFCKGVVAKLGDSYKGVKIRIKVVYDKRNFTALPSYNNYEWIERMTVPKENSKIRILPKDKMVKNVPATLEGAELKLNEIELAASEPEATLQIGEAQTTDATPANADDLPF